MTRFYLDHAATTPCRPEVWEEMRRVETTGFGNPNSFHSDGRRARMLLEQARTDMSHVFGCLPGELTLTGSGTEANHLALRGFAVQNRGRGHHIVTSAVEHAATINTCRQLEREGFEVTYVPVDVHGLIDPDTLAATVRPDTILVSLAHANHEVGTIQDIVGIAAAVRSANALTRIHVDGVQTVGHLPCLVDALDADLLSFTAHKFYGPKGIGGLFVRPGVMVAPQIQGGGQEHGLRSGTEAVSLAVGMSAALQIAVTEMSAESALWRPVRDSITRDILSRISDARLNGHESARLPTNASFSFFGISGEDLVLRLDRLGYSTSTGSACSTGKVDPSPVLMALGLSRGWALGSLRLSFGKAAEGIDPSAVGAAVSAVVAELRSTHYSPGGARIAA